MKRDIGKEILAGLDEVTSWRRGKKKLRVVPVAKPKGGKSRRAGARQKAGKAAQ